MKVDMVMPQMGESITEATISKWVKNRGDLVKKDEIILEISTDKVDSEIPAPASGILSEVLYKEGDVVPVKTKIAVIDESGKANGSPSVQEPEIKTQAPAVSNGAPTAPVADEIKSAPSPKQIEAQESDQKSERFYSPLVKSLAQKHNISLSELDSIKGSGSAGRVNKEDFLQYVEQRGKSQPPAAGAELAQQKSTRAPVPPASVIWGDDETKVIPMDNMRQAIAEHMVRSKKTSPHVYSVQEVDMTAVSKWRQKHKGAFAEKEGFNLSFTPFFLEAAVKALLEFPHVNSSVDGNKIILKKNINLGCAVALGTSGLIVPVIKKSEEKNLVGLARGLDDLAKRARTKKLMPDDIMGGTFTVTNPGVFGTMIGTPIINQPQVAILCLGAIKKRPVVVDDMIGIREICYLTLSYDHRIVDGSLGGQFLAFIREYLENWDANRPLY
jgi:2-oxoglutarate dehydrogenase E2 component (dihydrolipoamide succinyltransferase)